MKKVLFLLITACIVCSCAQNPKKDSVSESGGNSNEAKQEIANEDSEKSMEQLGGVLNAGDESENPPEAAALEKLLQMSGGKEDGDMNSFQEMISTQAILDMLESSGVSRAEMERLINNPDSLRILAQKAIKDRKEAKQNEPALKGKLPKEQLTSKNTPTGVSLEEAILLVQAESGPEATMAKLKKIDSLAGTNVMEQLDLTEAGYVLADVARKNEPKASFEEEEKIKALRAKSGQTHSVKEVQTLFAELEDIERAIASGAIEASPKYQRTVEHQKKTVKIFRDDFIRKARAAKNKFRKLNPNLYFGEAVGETYMGHMKKAVYLPLGKLSFADRVVKADHPQLMVQQVKNVIGEPDVIETFDDVTGIHSLGLGGMLTIQFIDNALTDVNGPDLYIFEIGQIEPTDLEISKDGKTWIRVGKIDGGVAEVDIGPFVKKGELFYYVRLTDLKKESALPGADVDAIAAIGAAMRLNLDSKVLFETGKSTLKPEGVIALKKLVVRIAILKRGSIIVEGYTDDVGSDQTNQKLSLARAKSVSAELKKLIPSTNFRWKEKGLGASKPIVENNSEENRAKNRRVEVLVLPN